MRLGPDDVLVAARVDVDDAASGGDLEQVADDVERRIREAYPEVRHVFLDPTTARGDGRAPPDAWCRMITPDPCA